MGDPFVGEIRMFPYTFPPMYWAWCDGQTVPFAQYQTLASILGTYFGGDGRTTVGLPNLKGRSPMHQGTGTGLTPRPFAATSGDATITLTEAQMPNHNHTAQASIERSTQSVPTAGTSYPALMYQHGSTDVFIYGYHTPDDKLTSLAPQSLAAAGQGLAHDNRQPSLGLYFCIALEGIYPIRP